MSNVKERTWKENFTQLPTLLKIVVLWVYFVSIAYWLKFLFTLILRLSLSPFDLAFGYLIWVLADGLINGNKIARIITLVYFSFLNIVLVYIAWSGGKVSIGDITLTITSSFSIIQIVVNSISILVLLLPHIQRFFSSSFHEEII